MALGWIALLKGVPWTGVISTAPLVVDGAKQLWKAVSKKPPFPEPAAVQPVSTQASASPAIAALENQVSALETAVTDLHAQMLKSSELITALASQNAELIQRIETHRIRTRWLTGAALVAALAGLAVALLG